MKKEISLIRIIATLAVLFLHTCNSLTANVEMFGVTEQQYSFFSSGTTLMMWAVPIFLMITGELLLTVKKDYSYNGVIRKYVKRMVIALFVFGVPFSILEIVSKTKTIEPSYILKAFVNVINGDSWDHLWYVYVIIGIYLMLPFIKKGLDGMNINDVKHLILILFIINIAFPYINICTGSSIEFSMPIAGYSMLYVLIGYFICQRYSDNKLNLWILSAVFLGATAVQVIICILCKNSFLKYVGYDSPFTVITSTTLYLIAKNKKIVNIMGACTCDKTLWSIDRLCFGAYLVHPFFINLVYKFLKVYPVKYDVYPLVTLALWIVFCVLSFGASWFVSKVPVLKKIM